MSTPTTPRPGAPDLPLACVPGAIPAAERPAHFALLARLFGGAARERRAAPDGPEGYAFRFDAGAFDDVARFVANERRCCPFLAFALDLAPDGGPLWLRLSGPRGTRAFLDAELGLAEHRDRVDARGAAHGPEQGRGRAGEQEEHGDA